MKQYEDLTKAEKEKLNAYLLARGNASRLPLTFILGALMFYAIGLPLFVSTKLWFGGLCMMFVSLLIFLLVMVQLVQTNKYIYLAFDMESSMEDMFEIKRTDLFNLRRKWKRPKEDK